MGDTFDLDAELGESGTRAPSGPNPSDFFNGNGIDLAKLVSHVRCLGPVARGIDGKLWHYQAGVWKPGGDEEVGRRVRDALQGRFRLSHLNGVHAWFRQDQVTITGEAHREYVNVLNGLLRWRTGELEPHRPDVRSTVQLPVVYDPDADCPTIDDWLVSVIPYDAHAFIDELLGYLVLNGNPLHVAMLLLGSGRNGKGTFLRLVNAMLGAANVSSVPLQTMAENRFAAASMFGKLANICGDLDARMMDRSDVFKMATGGDVLYAEHKYGASFTFSPWATMLFSANQAPPSRDTSEGYYARWLVVPFTANLTGKLRPQHELDAELHRQAELEGLFARSIVGLQRLMARGRFDPPESVLAANQEFRQTTDPVASFVADCCVLHPDLEMPRTDVFTRYRQWCEDNGHRPLATSRFYDRLGTAATGVRMKVVRGTRTIEGLGKGDEW